MAFLRTRFRLKYPLKMPPSRSLVVAIVTWGVSVAGEGLGFALRPGEASKRPVKASPPPPRHRAGLRLLSQH